MSVTVRRSQIIVVGQKIRQIRKSRRLTQADLASRIGVTQSDLSRMENGEYKVGLDTLFRILQVFELSMSRFFEESAAEPAETEEAAPPDVATETQLLVADFEELDEDSRREVRDFVAFKKIQQQNRQPRWRPESAPAEPEPAPAGPLLPFGRPNGSSRPEQG
jgi:transcriptional regulator with XRE-family HTH domain